MKGMIATDITFQDSYFSRDKNQISLTNKYKSSDLLAACNVKLQPTVPLFIKTDHFRQTFLVGHIVCIYLVLFACG